MSSSPEGGPNAAMHEDLSWRVLVDGTLSGAANMARDHAVAAALRPGTGTVRFYRWSPATLSLGRNEPLTVGYRNLLRRHPWIGVVRRPTGGRAVIHDRELTYSVALPARAFGGPRRAYRKINEGMVEGLRGLGVDACLAAGTALPPDAGPCFLEAAEGEVVVGGRKLVGSAQVRIADAVLQHGSVLLVADQGPLLEGVGQNGGVPAGISADREGPGRGRPSGWNRGRVGGNGKSGNDLAVSSGSVTLSQVLGEAPSWEVLVNAFSRGFAHALGGSWRPGRLTSGERTLAAELEHRYGSAAWTQRR